MIMHTDIYKLSGARCQTRDGASHWSCIADLLHVV